MGGNNQPNTQSQSISTNAPRKNTHTSMITIRNLKREPPTNSQPTSQPNKQTHDQNKLQTTTHENNLTCIQTRMHTNQLTKSENTAKYKA